MERTEKQHQRPVEWVRRKLTEQIASGRLQPGDMLPGERVLAATMNIGRGSVRLALAELEAQGLLRRRPRRGTQVVAKPGAHGTLPKIVLVNAYTGALFAAERLALHLGIADRLKARGYTAAELFVGDQALPDSLRGGLGGALVRPGQLAAALANYDAVLFHELVTPESREVALAWEREHRPAVVANLEPECPVSCTRIDHRKVFREATDILVRFGHRRIGFVGRDRRLFFYRQAFAGYCDSLRAAGLTPAAELTAAAALPDALSGCIAAQKLLALNSPPTAMVAGRDILAQGACYAIEEAGLRVGFDVSVVSYDNLSSPAVEPFLTTFDEPAYEMGTLAVDMLLKRLIGGWRPVEQRILDAPLMLRRSAGPCDLVRAGSVNRRIGDGHTAAPGSAAMHATD